MYPCSSNYSFIHGSAFVCMNKNFIRAFKFRCMSTFKTHLLLGSNVKIVTLIIFFWRIQIFLMIFHLIALVLVQTLAIILYKMFFRSDQDELSRFLLLFLESSHEFNETFSNFKDESEKIVKNTEIKYLSAVSAGTNAIKFANRDNICTS